MHKAPSATPLHELYRQQPTISVAEIVHSITQRPHPLMHVWGLDGMHKHRRRHLCLSYERADSHLMNTARHMDLLGVDAPKYNYLG